MSAIFLIGLWTFSDSVLFVFFTRDIDFVSVYDCAEWILELLQGKIDSTNEKPENTTHSEQFQNPIAKIEDKGKIDAPITHIYGRSPPWLGTCTLIAE
jgi:hypothetical protein